ncbi:MAG: chloride channel protein [Ignavibacteriales bacterium]|nr:chloride channel protein [Ignavibacteriales bacterium]
MNNESTPTPAESSSMQTVNSSHTYFNKRAFYISGLSVLLGVASGFVAKILISLIGIITNLAFYGKFSLSFTSPKDNHLGLFVIIVPIIGALIVGLMARYGSKGIRGHGIPEAMEQVLTNKSKISPRLTVLKPISAAISIGTGGPFGAEGPIIATGGALGSFIGQLFPVNADERKILLAAGAAGGMAATFGSPISAILLAIELLLFEFKPKSLLPVTLASGSATAVRFITEGVKPVFATAPFLLSPTEGSLIAYFILGIVIGFASVLVTKSVYAIEDMFEKLPIHWMWWPALGAIAVGVIGFFVPATLGVGYDNITNIINGNISGPILIALFIAKFFSWSISLGSGTSGGTLAPLFTIGGGLGAALTTFALFLFPNLGIDPRMAALVGMAALFTGASRAILTSIVFAFETTMQPAAILPLLACCSASYLVSILLMKQTIMTEKIARRGIRVPHEYEADHLNQMNVARFATKNVVSIYSEDILMKVREWLTKEEIRFHTFPVVDAESKLTGIVTKKGLLSIDQNEEEQIKNMIAKPLVVLLENDTIREAADLMAEHDLNSIPVVEDLDSMNLTGIISRSDILRARKQKIDETKDYERTIRFSNPWDTK